MKRLRITIAVLLLLSAAAFGISRGVVLLNKDDTVPEISCEAGVLSINASDGEQALLQGVTAYDGKDGDLSDKIVVESIVGTGTLGQVNVTYAVSDSDHHVSSCVRTVEYTDYVSPRFSLSKPLIYTVGEGLRVRDRLSASDIIDGSLTERIKVNASSSSTYYAGSFPITFEVTNSLGDTTTLTLDFIVRESVYGAPEINLTQYLVYLAKGEKLSTKSYVSSVVNGENRNVKATLPAGGLKEGVNTVTYSCTNGDGLTGTTVLYVVVE